MKDRLACWYLLQAAEGLYWSYQAQEEAWADMVAPESTCCPALEDEGMVGQVASINQRRPILPILAILDYVSKWM